VSDARTRGVVVDSMVVSWFLDERPNPIAERYRKLIGMEPVVLGRAATSTARTPHRRVRRRPARRRDDHSLRPSCAELRMRCRQAGHALGEKLHDGDRWIAATAIRIENPFVSHDGIFTEAPGLRVVTDTA